MLFMALTYTLLFVSMYFEVFLLVAFLENRFAGVRATTSVARELPRVCIAVPCYNEEKTIEATLQSLLKLNYPADKLEIIVVDDGSRDETFPIAKGFENTLPGRPRISVFHKENGGKHTAMNFALAHTDAELFGCLDADSFVGSEALREIVPAFAQPGVAAVVPGIHVKDPRTVLQLMQHVEYRLSIFNRFVQAALGSAFITPGPFSIFRTAAVREVGQWRHGHSTEDMELALRLQQRGYFIANAPAAIVHTTTPRTLRGLFRQRVRWTYGFIRNMVDYRSMIGSRKYGNLGLFVLPAALASIGIGLYFFVRLIVLSLLDISDLVGRYLDTGVMLRPSWSLFTIDTSVLWILVFMSIALVVGFICAGTSIGTDRRLPPSATPLFILLYCFIAPLWLGAALARAIVGAEARWR